MIALLGTIAVLVIIIAALLHRRPRWRDDDDCRGIVLHTVRIPPRGSPFKTNGDLQ